MTNLGCKLYHLYSVLVGVFLQTAWYRGVTPGNREDTEGAIVVRFAFATKSCLRLLLVLAVCTSQLALAGSIAKLELVASGLTLPVALAYSGDGSGRLFIAELGGVIRVFRNGNLSSVTFLDIRDRVSRIKEGGLTGLTFHPQFAQNKRFFIAYTTGPEDAFKLVVSEFRGVSLFNPNRADPTEKIILEIDQPSANHQAGDLAFGPDGFLYIASGDGGPPGDPFEQGQDLSTLLGAILRIDVDSEEEPYGIPSDNPFIDNEEARDEIWAYGLRNPFRFSFDHSTGRLFAGDVGETVLEEIDLIVRGGNYGWSVMEASACYPPSVQTCDTEGLILPISQYGRDEGSVISVTGGLVYRGTQSVDLFASYLFGDFPTGRIFSLRETSSDQWERRQLLHEPSLQPVAFTANDEGEIYLASLQQGKIYRLKFGWQLLFAQAADGLSGAGVFQTTVLLANGHETDLSATIKFFNSQGSPTPVTIAGVTAAEVPVVIPAASSRSFVTSGESDPFLVGWIQVEADRFLSGSLLYGLSGDGPIRVAGVSESPLGRNFTTHVGRSSTIQTGTAFALVNPSAQDTAQIQATIRDLKGAPVASDQFELQPLQQTALFIGEVGTLPEEFEGTLAISSDRDVAPTLILTIGGIHSASLEFGLAP